MCSTHSCLLAYCFRVVSVVAQSGHKYNKYPSASAKVLGLQVGPLHSTVCLKKEETAQRPDAGLQGFKAATPSHLIPLLFCSPHTPSPILTRALLGSHGTSLPLLSQARSDGSSFEDSFLTTGYIRPLPPATVFLVQCITNTTSHQGLSLPMLPQGPEKHLSTHAVFNKYLLSKFQVTLSDNSS